MTIRFEPHGAAKGFYAAFGHKDALPSENARADRRDGGTPMRMTAIMMTKKKSIRC